MMALLFQDCGKVNFDNISPSPTLYASDGGNTTPAIIAPGGGAPAPGGSGDGTGSGNGNGTGTGSGSGSGTGTGSGTGSGTATGSGGTGTSSGGGGSMAGGCGNNNGPSNNSSSDVVECDLGSPSVKIAFSNTLGSTSSNASNDRVCMSTKACLSIINDYAVARDCTLSPGAPTQTSSNPQCTQVFPGNGVCNNATTITDTEVANALASMAGS